jgi:phosphoribosylglycinamide formyltransferase-1
VGDALVAVLASGEGTTAEALIRAGAEGEIGCEVGLIISSSASAGVLARVERLNRELGCGVEAVCIGGASHPAGPAEKLRKGDQTAAEAAAMGRLLELGSFELIVLMGYLRRVGPNLVYEFGWRPSYTSVYQARMLNTHPGPLPETRGLYGSAVQEHVLGRNLPCAAHVVHVVAEEYDHGPIVVEHRTPVLPDDSAMTLSERIKSLQREHLPRDLGDFVRQRRSYLRARQVAEASREETAPQAERGG